MGHLLTEAEAAQYCRYFDRGCAHPVRAFQQHARRAGIAAEPGCMSRACLMRFWIGRIGQVDH
jgi:hypothetical protein